MSTPTTSARDHPPSPTTTSNQDSTTDNSPPTQYYYNYLFLLLAAVILLLALLLIQYVRRRRQSSQTRLQQHGRAALVRDVARFPNPVNASHSPFFWSQRPPSEYSTAEEEGVVVLVEQQQQGQLRSRTRTQNPFGDSDLETGLDENGEAPPPYGTAAAATATAATTTTTTTASTRVPNSDKNVSMPGREFIGLRTVETQAVAGQRWHRTANAENGIGNGLSPAPPGYDWRNRMSGDGDGDGDGTGVDHGLPLARPPAAVTVVERVVEVGADADEGVHMDFEERSLRSMSSQNAAAAHRPAVRPEGVSTRGRRGGRRSLIRRLMGRSTDESSSSSMA